MKLPAFAQRGAVVPILPILGLIVLAIGIGLAVTLVNRPQDVRSRASEITPAPVSQKSRDLLLSAPTPSPSTGNQRKFSDLLK